MAENNDNLPFISDYRLISMVNSDAPLNIFKRSGAEAYRKQKLPNFHNPGWEYFDLSAMLNKNYTLDAEKFVVDDITRINFLEVNAISMVFLNGIFTPALSSTEDCGSAIQLIPFSEKIPDAAQGAFADNAFASLNTAYANSGMSVRVMKGAKINRPLHLIFIGGGENRSLYFPRLLINVEQEAELSLIASHVSLGGAIFFENNVLELNLEAKAKVNYYQYYNTSANSDIINNTFIKLGEEATLNNVSFLLKGGFVHNNVEVDLNGEASECHLRGVYVGRDASRLSQKARVTHFAPASKSTQLYKGVAADSSQVALGLNLHVGKNALAANANQLHQGMLISENARIAASPELNVDNGDVECSHGSSIGDISEAELFYLMSRGLSKKEARRLLVHAHLEEILGYVHDGEIRAALAEYLWSRVDA